MMRQLLVAVLIAIVPVTVAAAQGSTAEVAETAASIEVLAWLAGSWHGEGFGGHFEEVWSPPSAGTMVGSFKLVRGNEPVMYELVLIRPGESGLEMRHLEVHHDGGVYRGFSAQVWQPDPGRWVRQYVNDISRTYAVLEGKERDGASIWRPADPSGQKRSRLREELSSGRTWHREMSVSDDGGESWRVLWVDTLQRDSSGDEPQAQSSGRPES